MLDWVEPRTVATSMAPFRYEAWQLQGEAAVMMVQQSAGRGDQVAADAFTAVAEEGFSEAARLARSDPDASSGLCTLWGMVMGIRLYGGGGEIATPLADAVAACDQALVADPRRTEERRNKAICYRQMAEHAIRTGDDPVEWLERARTCIREVLEIDPDDPDALFVINNHAWALYQRGKYELLSGDDPERALSECISIAERAVAIKLNHVTALNAIGQARLLQARFMQGVGRDPSAALDGARAIFEEILTINPEWAIGRAGLLSVLAVRADHVASNGGDASDLIERGLTAGAELYALPPVAKEVRWDYANLLVLAADGASQPAARRRLARQAAELFDRVPPVERLPRWHDRRELARRLSGR